MTEENTANAKSHRFFFNLIMTFGPWDGRENGNGLFFARIIINSGRAGGGEKKWVKTVIFFHAN